MIDLFYWFMFPVAIFIASIAMMTGIGGAILFAPFFMLALKIDPLIALGAGLFIEVFGFSSGVIGYYRSKSINFRIVKKLIVITIPATILGVIFGRFIDVRILKIILSLLLLYLAYNFICFGPINVPKHPLLQKIKKTHEKIFLPINVKILTGFGALLLGMISAGLGELNNYNFLKKLKLEVAESSGTSVFLVATAAIIGVISHAYFLMTNATFQIFSVVVSILVFSVPGVIIGAQFGVILAHKIRLQIMGKFVGVLFTILAIATIFTII